MEVFIVVFKDHLADVWNIDWGEICQKGTPIGGHCALLDKKEQGGGRGSEGPLKSNLESQSYRAWGAWYVVGRGQGGFKMMGRFLLE